MELKSCTQGDDSTCTDTYPLGCCAAVWFELEGDDDAVRALQSMKGYPLMPWSVVHLCHPSVDALAEYKDNLMPIEGGYQWRVYCDAAQMVKATLIAASAVFAASTF